MLVALFYKLIISKGNNKFFIQSVYEKPYKIFDTLYRNDQYQCNFKS